MGPVELDHGKWQIMSKRKLNHDSTLVSSSKKSEKTIEKAKVKNPSLSQKLMLWMTNPDNVGTIQLILFFNTIALSGSFYTFQWIYGVDPITYSMRYYSPHAVQQDTETTTSEFTLT